MSIEAKGQRVNINGTVTNVLYKDETSRNTLSQLTYPGHDQAIMGTDSYVCDMGQKFAPTLVSNTSLKLADGEGVLQGVRFRIPYGSTVALTIAAGTSGYKRIDLVVARYTKSTGEINFVVIKGTNATSSPATPAYNTGSVLEGAATVDFPMYKITLDGTTVSSVDKLFTQLQTMKEMQDAISKLNTDWHDIGVEYVDYGNISLSQGRNAFSITGVTYANLRGAIVQFGDILLPSPNINYSTGATDNSFGIAISVDAKNEKLVLTTSSSWQPRKLYALFFFYKP